MKGILSRLGAAVGDQQFRTTAILLVAIAAAIAYFGARYLGFLSAFNLVNVAVQTSVISLVAFGMTGVIVVRGIDLSVGSTLAFASVVGAKVLSAGNSSSMVVVSIFAVAIAAAAFNGFLVAVLNVNAFMATLGMYALARGAAIALSGGDALPITNETLLFLGRESLFGVLPWSIIVTIVALVLAALMLRRTMLGRWYFAVGGNVRAARATGIPARAVQFSAFLLIGGSVGLGALLTIGRDGSAQPMAGIGLEFSAITAAVIGGASLAGGRGSVVSTFLGSIFVGVLTSGLSFAGVKQSSIYIYTGLLTVIAVVLSQREVVQQIGDNAVFFRNSLRAMFARRRQPATASTAADKAHSLELIDLSKSFSGVQVLRGICCRISSGEIVALLGENGAGKSTLVKAIAGNHQPTSGLIDIDGEAMTFAGPEDARKAGIAVIHQHFSLVGQLTVAQNMFLGQELRYGQFGPMRRRQMNRDTDLLLDELGMPFRATDVVSDLGVGHRQMIEIVRAVRENAWLVIMDEPTSALSSRERDHLYELIERLKKRRTAILYISHRMDEIYRLCSRAVVLRDGELVGSPNLAETDSAGLVSLMVGRDIDSTFPHTQGAPGDEIMVATDVSDGGRLVRATATVRRGEVVGLVGLMGAGRTELIRTIAGLSRPTHGSLTVFGEPVAHRSLHQLTRQGLAFVPEDRHEEGIFPEMTVGANISMLWLRRHARIGLLSRRAERSIVAESVRTLNVRPPDPGRVIKNLSGGNQQKVVLGKWLALDPELILLDDPTRGVDVGAKAEIHTLIAEHKARGAGVLVTSSEIPEVLSVSDRIIVMRDGVTVAEYGRGVSEEEVMGDAFGELGAQSADEIASGDGQSTRPSGEQKAQVGS